MTIDEAIDDAEEVLHAFAEMGCTLGPFDSAARTMRQRLALLRFVQAWRSWAWYEMHDRDGVHPDYADALAEMAAASDAVDEALK